MKNILIIAICLICFCCSFDKEHNDRNIRKSETFKITSTQTNRDTTKTNVQLGGGTETTNSSAFVNSLLVVLISVFFSILIILVYNRITLRNKIISATVNSNRVKNLIKSLLPQSNSLPYPPKINSKGSYYELNSTTIDIIVNKVLERIKKENPDLFNMKEDNVKLIPTKIPAIEIFEVQKKKINFYSVEPRDGESFNGSIFSEDFIPTESVYIIELQNENLAHFSIITDNDTMGRAIKYKKDLIDIACKSLSSSMDAKSIITSAPGIAQKDGNKWIIKQQAQIKFV